MHCLKDELYRITCLVSDIDASYHQASVKLGLSDSACIVLYMLYANGYSCSLNDIYRLSGISKQTINSAIRKLEKDGVVCLEQLDGKAKKVCSTEMGRAYIGETAAKVFEAELAAFDSWTKEEIEQMVYILEKYNACFKKQVERL